MKSKLIIDFSWYGTIEGGMKNYSLDFINSLSEENKKKIIIIIPSQFSKSFEGFNIFPIKKKFYKNKYLKFLYEIFFRQIFLKIVLDSKNLKKIKHIFFPVTPPPIFLNKEIYFTIHDLGPILKPKYYNLAEKFLWDLSLRPALSKCNHIFFVSEFSRMEFKKKFENIGIKTSVSYFRNTGNLKQNETTSKTNLNENFFLTVGTHVRRKNYEYLLKIIKSYNDSYDPVKLYIIGGKGNNYKNIKKLIKYLNLTNSVELLTNIKDSEMSEIYRRCLLYITTSFYEGFNIPVLEAATYNKRIVSTPLETTTEVIGSDFIKIPYNDHIAASEIIHKGLSNPIKPSMYNIENYLQKPFNGMIKILFPEK